MHEAREEGKKKVICVRCVQSSGGAEMVSNLRVL